MSDQKKSIATISGYNAAIIPLVVTIACLVPFVGKAFHIDDPLFIYAARHIQTNPTNFYDFKVNWFSTLQPMVEVAKNPPVTCYYIALVGSIIGWSEVALHTAFIIPAVAVALGTYYLAKRFCSRPVLAALAAVLTPAFLVSGTNIMCDVMMLAFWVWAVVLWMKGMETDDWLSLFFAAVLIAVSALTKYFGMSLLALLFVYSFMKKRKLCTWVLFLLIPVGILMWYQWMTSVLYGRGLLLDAASYATQSRWMGSTKFLLGGLVGFSFTGGCIITALFFGPLVWSRRIWGRWAILTVLLIFVLGFMKKIDGFSTHNTNGVKWGFLIQFVLMVVTGASIVTLAITDFWRHKNADSFLLLLWVGGTFIFAAFINWTVNSRSVLPMVPAVGILLARRMERYSQPARRAGVWRTAWPLIPAALVAMAVGWADYVFAGTAYDAAAALHERFKNAAGKVWFQGHWGFQYYMEANGYQPLDCEHLEFVQGDVIVVPTDNTNTFSLQTEKLYLSKALQFNPRKVLATMSMAMGAGFYADRWGPVPFVAGSTRPEKYYVFIVK